MLNTIKQKRISKSINSTKDPRFHPKRTLVPQPLANGVRMWSVALEKTMFTYFEIDPKSRFDLHSHMNEQITMVLEGELFFKFTDKIVCVKKGDVIAIPSKTPHEVFTKTSSVIAVDAWSPVMEKYRDKEMDNQALANERVLAGCVGMKP